jgi:hypothetical protein
MANYGSSFAALFRLLQVRSAPQTMSVQPPQM